MKTRSDFVSNSSSSSFVVAINKQYGLKSFCKDVASESESKRDEFHDPNLKWMNYVNLAFNLQHYELLFLGSYVVSRAETIIDRRSLPKKIGYFKFTKEEFDKQVELINKWKKIKDDKSNSEWLYLSHLRDDSIDKQGRIHQITRSESFNLGFDISGSYILSRNLSLEDDIKSGKATKQQIEFYDKEKQRRLDEIKRISRLYVEDSSKVPSSDTYQITMNTIKNTREMLEAGFEITFREWENLDALEKRLRSGEKLIAIKANYEGDGYSKDAIYCEENSKFLSMNSRIAMECIGSRD